MNPTVSILVAAYNEEQHLAECLESLIGQSYQNLQIVVIDDYSTDSTPQIIKEYSLRDKRILPLRMPSNCGPAKTRNYGLLQSTGEYVTMVDADDILSADAISSAMNCFAENPDTNCVLFNLQYLMEDGSIVPYKIRSSETVWSGTKAFLLSLDWSIHGLYVAKMELYRKYPFDMATKLYSDDNTTRLHFLYSGMVRMCQGIYFYRQYEGNMTNSWNMSRFDLWDANTSMNRTMVRERKNLQEDDPFCDVLDKAIVIFERQRWLNLIGVYEYYLEHKQFMSAGERISVIRNFSKTYRSIKKRLLSKRLRCKPGYIPIRPLFLFRLELRILFLLRRKKSA